MFSLEKISENKVLLIVISLIFGILIFSSILFFVWGKLKPQANLTELKARTKSWWAMATIFVCATIFNPIISFIAFGFLSFVALRELISISKNIRTHDRRILIWCYLAVPVQYYLAYKGYYGAFLIFIPIFMFLWIPFMLVIKGETEGITKSMSVLPTQLMFCVFGISHLAYLLSLPEIPGFKPGGRGLLLFLVFLTEMNDVFQFTWGKLFGKYKILPKVSPNKTWEGFIGGLINNHCRLFSSLFNSLKWLGSCNGKFYCCLYRLCWRCSCVCHKKGYGCKGYRQCYSWTRWNFRPYRFISHYCTGIFSYRLFSSILK